MDKIGNHGASTAPVVFSQKKEIADENTWDNVRNDSFYSASDRGEADNISWKPAGNSIANISSPPVKEKELSFAEVMLYSAIGAAAGFAGVASVVAFNLFFFGGY